MKTKTNFITKRFEMIHMNYTLTLLIGSYRQEINHAFTLSLLILLCHYNVPSHTAPLQLNYQEAMYMHIIKTQFRMAKNFKKILC